MAGAQVDDEKVARTMGEREFLVPAEVAVMARVSKQTIYRFIHHGQLRASKVGRQFRIEKTDVEKLLAKQEEGSPQGPQQEKEE